MDCLALDEQVRCAFRVLDGRYVFELDRRSLVGFWMNPNFPVIQCVAVKHNEDMKIYSDLYMFIENMFIFNNYTE